MTLLHIAIELFFVAVGAFSVWAIYRTIKDAMPAIKELFRD